MKLKAVLFDLDGTLLDTLHDIADNANESLARLGYPTHPADAYRYFVGNGVDNLMKAILPDGRRSPEDAAALKAIYAPLYAAHSMDKTRPYDGVAETLGELRRGGFKLAVVSNKPDSDTKFTISKTFGEGIFDAVAGGRAGTPLKPDPAIVNFILSELGIAASESLFVGDTGVDIATAKNASCPSVGVLWGFRPEEVKSGGADYIISSPGELPRIAFRHGGERHA